MAEVELPNPEELHERGEDRFGRRVALVTAVFAVILSISSLGGNNRHQGDAARPAEVL